VNDQARASIRRLRTGVVPIWELDRLSVGYATPRALVASAFENLAEARATPPAFVRGEWGSGKTHFLSFVRSGAASWGVPCAKVDLNARSLPLNYPQRFYAIIAASLRFESLTGLQSVLTLFLRDVTSRGQLQAFAERPEAGDFAGPLRWLCYRVEHDDGDLENEWLWRTLLGADIVSMDYSYKRREALGRITALGRLFEALGLGGLVLLFDETETIDQLWNVRSRASAYSVLARLCQLPSVWCVFGITDRFRQAVEQDLARGVMSMAFATDDARWFLRAWNQERFHVIDPPQVDAAKARELAYLVANLYASAYSGAPVTRELVDSCVREWKGNPGRNPRRLIRLVIHRMDLHRPL
jgi:hypothetical protein